MLELGVVCLSRETKRGSQYPNKNGMMNNPFSQCSFLTFREAIVVVVLANSSIGFHGSWHVVVLSSPPWVVAVKYVVTKLAGRKIC